MLKNQSNKRKSKHDLLSQHNKQESNFKNQSISINPRNISFSKLLRISDFNQLPKKNDQIRIITKKLINSFDFILSILDNEDIIELYLTSYRIGKKTVIQLSDLINTNRIKNLTILINDGFPKFAPDVWNNLTVLNANIKLDNNHTKIFLIKTKDNYYTIEGSGNLSINARIEQYIIDNNKQIYSFHKNWIDKI